MDDNLYVYYDKFMDERSKPLVGRFPGQYRALVVDTNDPLQVGRVRVRVPELHDYDVKEADCPWAVPQYQYQSKRAGDFSFPCKGDYVWVDFEKGHPYSPIWTGMAAPTRRKYYTLQQISGITPTPVNETGKTLPATIDYDKQYLPQDGRPMRTGRVDRYGSTNLMSSVGYYPAEHAQKPANPDQDALQGSTFQQLSQSPNVNSPDLKYLAEVSKYGNIFVLGDQGYYWQSPLTQTSDNPTPEEQLKSELGEFTGDSEKDEKYEIDRWLYIQRLINEDQPSTANGTVKVENADQRRTEIKNRYGHRFEMRDVGWAQLGPIKSYTRPAEYGTKRVLSLEDQNDFRWIKLRTKAGFLLQGYDKGSHPQEDDYVSRPLIAECGHLSEREDLWWKDKDARWWRMATRHGVKLVLDDRGTDPRHAQDNEAMRCNGFMVKGRRTGAAGAEPKTGDPRGFSIEFNENDKLNRFLTCTPLGSTVELNDRYEYLSFCSSVGSDFATQWRGLEENEFNPNPVAVKNPQLNSHHLIIDHQNESIRLKSRAGHGVAPNKVVNRPGVQSNAINQGLEIHDGSAGDGPWVELVDAENRGIWLSQDNKLGVWRGKDGSNILQWFDDSGGQELVVIYNGNSSPAAINIYCGGSVNMRADRVRLTADSGMDLLSRNGDIRMQAGSTKFTIASSSTELRSNATSVFGGDSANAAPIPQAPGSINPSDRGVRLNSPIEACPIEEIEHPI